MNSENVLYDFSRAGIINETPDYILVFKPPKMHTVPGKNSGEGESGESENNLAEWCAARFPEIRGIRGRNNECGLLNRLDYETRGIVLFARNQNSFNTLIDEQKRGGIIKEYDVIAIKSDTCKPGFPPFPGRFAEDFNLAEFQGPYIIESRFRPYGPGRKEVRPVIDGDETGKLYRTEIIEIKRAGPYNNLRMRVRINRGFRHQIRCHLAWAGMPVINDPVYGNEQKNGRLGLCAQNIRFTDPGTGVKVFFTLPETETSDI